MVNILYIYCIHSQQFNIRALSSQDVIEKLRKTAINNNFIVKIIMILKPDPDDLQPTIEELQKKVKQDNTHSEIFTNYKKPFNIQMISNFEKHKETWKRIYNTIIDDSDNAFHYVIEDDVYLPQDACDNFSKLLNTLTTLTNKWDMIFSSIPYKETNDLELININIINIIPSKESYFITQRCARRLYDSFDNYIYIMRVQLSQFLINNYGFNVFFSSKRITIDGSKIGAFPSTIHETNHLIYNMEYMNLHSYLLKDENEIRKDIDTIYKIHKTVDQIKNSDIELLFSKILLKIGKLDEAKNRLLLAIMYAKSNKALLNNRCENINMLIDISGKTQDDLAELIKKPSKYSNYPLLSETPV